MPGQRRSQRRRRATLITFYTITLALSSVVAHDGQQQLQPQDSQLTEGGVSNEPIRDDASVASDTFNEAMHTLYALQPPPSQAASLNSQSSRSTLRSLFPNAKGPISTAVRIANRIRHVHWIPRWLSGRIDDGTGGPASTSSSTSSSSSRSWNLFRSSGSEPDPVAQKASKALDMLEYAADLGHVEAMYSLAQFSLFPPSWSALPINSTRAFRYYLKHADLTGNSTSQAHVAFFYATGYSPSGTTPPVQVDQARALLYYTFAAHGGNTGSAMVLGYRNWAGIGLNENCMAALDWYESAAEAAMAHFITGPPGGRTLPKTATKLSDLDGGIFGPGASVASTGINAYRPIIKAAKSRGTGETWDDLIGFYKFHADRGETEYAYRLGKIYYQGSIYHAPGGIASGAEGFGSVPQNFPLAKQYFLQVARVLWPAQPISGMAKKIHLTKHSNVDQTAVLHANWAAAYLGRMYMRGEGVKQDFKVARIWFERGAEYNDKECLNSLAVIWRDGLLEGKKDEKLAHDYFVAAASQDFAEAQVNLGKYHYYRAEYGYAIKYFEAAIRNGSPFEAFYYIASIHARRAQDPSSEPSVSAGSCGVAVSFFKMVTERGTWKHELVGEAERLWLGDGQGYGFTSALTMTNHEDDALTSDSRARDREAAKLRWWIAAEQGFEVAQNNLAYVLDQHKSMFSIRSAHEPNNQTARSALIQWTRSAAQHDVDALVKVGDYYYHGLGVGEEPQELLWEKAAGYYLSAVETQRSALAMWNLGWMYESGKGVNMDYHLAKRYYDMALDTNTEAYLPVLISLAKLYLKSLWYTLSGGHNKSLLLLNVEDSDQWRLTTALDDLGKRWRGHKSPSATTTTADDGTNAAEQAPPPALDDDPVQWAEEQKAAEIERARAEEDAYERGDFFSGDFLATGDPRHHHRQVQYDENGHEIEIPIDDFWETMFLCALVVMISSLMFVRARYIAQADVARRRHYEQQAREAQARRDAGEEQDEHHGAAGANGDAARGTQATSSDDHHHDSPEPHAEDPDAIPDIGIFPPGQEPPNL